LLRVPSRNSYEAGVGLCKRLYGQEMSNNTITRHRFRFGEEWYTMCITIDDWWLEEELVDMSDDMMRAGEEFAIEHRTN
jgi:hypothetical protein